MRIYAMAGRRTLHNRLPAVVNAGFRYGGHDAVCTRLAAAETEEAIGLARAVGMHGIIMSLPPRSTGTDIPGPAEVAAEQQKTEILSQAASTFTLLTGCEPPLAQMRREAEREGRARTNIALIGPSGAGKSTVARQMGELTGREVLDIDSRIEGRYGCSISRIFDDMGEEEFRNMEQAEIETLRTVSNSIVACGGGVVTRKENVEVIGETCVIVWLWAGVRTALDRIGRTGTRPLLDGDNPEAKARGLLEKRIPLYAGAADLVVTTEGMRPEGVAERIWHEVREAVSG